MTEHFFLIGAQRTGTTYLYNLLDDHPEIEMARPIKPEPKFFILDDLFGRGLDYYQSQFFSDQPGAWLKGDKSTSYIEFEKAAQRIAQTFPAAKILILVRDPIERAISNYWFSANNGLETLPLEAAFYQEEERWQDYDHAKISASPYAYLRRGRYMDYLALYERYLPTEQIKVIIHEQLIAEPQTVIPDVYAFLGVDSGFVPPQRDQQKKVNASTKQETKLSPELEAYLKDYFAKSNTQLAAHLGLDLRQWWACFR